MDSLIDSSMKRLIAFAAFAALMVSCMIDDGESNPHRESDMKGIAYDLTEYMVILPLDVLDDSLATVPERCLEEGWSADIQDGVRIERAAGRDSVWNVFFSGDCYRYRNCESLCGTSVFQLLPERVVEMPTWEVTLEATMVENGNYSGTVSTHAPLYCYRSRNGGSNYVWYEPHLEGSVSFTTFYQSRQMDTVTLDM